MTTAPCVRAVPAISASAVWIVMPFGRKVALVRCKTERFA
jgi:hypothetical protein